jgi:hypothetical protein
MRRTTHPFRPLRSHRATTAFSSQQMSGLRPGPGLTKPHERNSNARPHELKRQVSENDAEQAQTLVANVKKQPRCSAANVSVGSIRSF